MADHTRKIEFTTRMKKAVLNGINSNSMSLRTNSCNNIQPQEPIDLSNNDQFILNQIKQNSKEDVESLKDNLTKQFQVHDQKFCMFPNINDDNYLISNNSFLGTENVEYFKIPFHAIEEIMF